MRRHAKADLPFWAPYQGAAIRNRTENSQRIENTGGAVARKGLRLPLGVPLCPRKRAGKDRYGLTSQDSNEVRTHTALDRNPHTASGFSKGGRDEEERAARSLLFDAKLYCAANKDGTHKAEAYGPMKLIPLTQGLSAGVDNDDFPELSQFKWRAVWNSQWRKFVAVRGRWTRDRRTGKRRLELISIAHHLLGKRPPLVIDHRNRDPLDNRRENLRWATRSQNQINQRPRKSRLGIRGVYPKRERFVVQFRWQKKLYRWHGFTSRRDAIEFYERKNREIRGEFAQPNRKEVTNAI